MDFFDLQDQARRRTVRLFALYLLALVLVILLLFLAAVLVVEGFRFLLPRPATPRVPAWQDLHLLGWMVVYVLLIVGGGTLYRWLDLRSGGGAVARMFCARRVDTSGLKLTERQVVNVVEEMAIAAGIPVPEIYILDRQRSINAMAAGYSTDDAAILLTRGGLEHLARDELQGVIAHEFSHILNGDMRLNLRLVSLLNGLVAVHLAGATLLRFVYDRDEAVGINLARGFASSFYGVAVLIVGFSFQAAGYVGAVAARLIQAGVSRQREFLADAAAVQFTRNPAGIAGALIKIGGHVQGGTVRDAHAEETSHMFIVEVVNYAHSLFDSHPPLIERIRRIDPSFDGEFPPLREPDRSAVSPPSPPRQEEEPPRRDRWLPPAVGGLAGVVALEAVQLERAQRILRGIPAALREALHETPAAEAILFLLLSWDRPAALDGMKRAQPAVAEAFDRLLPELRNLCPEAILPLAEMLLPALHLLSLEQYQALRRQMEEAVAEKGLSLSGFCLRQLVLHHLDRHFHLKRPGPRLRATVLGKGLIVLGALARAGTKETQKAWEAAKAALPPELRDAPLPSPAECSHGQLSEALAVLPDLSMRLKKSLLEAAVFCVAADEKLAPEEAELVHMLAAVLGLPAPSILGLNLPGLPALGGLDQEV